jgi:hypothetical protein
MGLYGSADLFIIRAENLRDIVLSCIILPVAEKDEIIIETK